MNHAERKLKRQLQEMEIGHEQKKAQRKAAKFRRAELPRAVAPGFDGRAGLKTAPEELESWDLPTRAPLARSRRRAVAKPALAAPIGRAADTRQALVIALAPGFCRVLDGDQEVEARLAPAVAMEQRTGIAVGDEVLVLERSGVLRVEEVLPRRRSLARPDPHNSNLERVLAANVDLVLIATALRAPGVKPGLIDRMMLAANVAGIDAAICVNKVDLAGGAQTPTRDEELELLAPYRAMGIAVVLCSARTGLGISTLSETIGMRTAVLVGQSGCGKTSLLNALLPGLLARTGATGVGNGKGRHTTTASSLHRLAGGGRLIDTPGVRQFGLWQPTPEALAAGFPEIAGLAERCRFRDCRHGEEPGCAVVEGVRAGEVAAARRESYLRLLEEL